MTETPRVDALVNDGGFDPAEMQDLAEELETSLIATQKECDQYKKAWDDWRSLQTGDAQKLFDAAMRCEAAEQALADAKAESKLAKESLMTMFDRKEELEQALALRGEPTMGMWDDFCSVFPVPFDDFLKAYKFMVGNMPALRGEPVAKEAIVEIADRHVRQLWDTVLDIDFQRGIFESAILEALALYAAPISGERVREACAQIASDMPLKTDELHSYRWSDEGKAVAWDIAKAIRALPLAAQPEEDDGICEPHGILFCDMCRAAQPEGKS